MEYVVQALKVLRNLVHAETNARCQKNGFYAASLIQTRFLSVFNDLWELACEFSIVIYGNIRACIKFEINKFKCSKPLFGRDFLTYH